ncbi:hypothetical protein Pelo_17367 [Pelomyxa schiedti]|nr:hypothetical protein Pelo_17367 [Pelomyxa schiedti]
MIYRAECARYHDVIRLWVASQPSRTISFSPLVTVKVTICFAFPISAASAFATLFKVDNQVPNLLRNACLLALASELQVLAEPVQPPDSLPELSFTLSTISPLVTILSTVITFDVTISRMRLLAEVLVVVVEREWREVLPCDWFEWNCSAGNIHDHFSGSTVESLSLGISLLCVEFSISPLLSEIHSQSGATVYLHGGVQLVSQKYDCIISGKLLQILIIA